MRYEELYAALKEKYDRRVGYENADLARSKDALPQKTKEIYLTLAAYGGTRGPFFRDGDAEKEFFSHFEQCGGQKYLRDDIISLFEAYPDAFAAFCAEYEKSDADGKKCLALYASLMVQLMTELDRWLKKTPFTPAERSERSLHAYAASVLANDYRNVWRLNGACDWTIHPADRVCDFYFTLREPVWSLYCESEAEVGAIKDKKAELEKLRAAKIREGAIFNVDACMFNTWRFGCLRENGQYYMFDHYVDMLKENGIFERFDDKFGKLDRDGRKMLSLLTISMMVLRAERKKKSDQYDGASLMNNQKEKWETAIYIEAYNELEKGFAGAAEKFGVEDINE